MSNRNNEETDNTRYLESEQRLINTLMDRHEKDLARRGKGKGRPKKLKRKPGGGRPPIPVELHRLSFSISLPADLINVVEQERRRRAGSSGRYCAKSHVIEDLIRQVLMEDSRASVASRESDLAEELKYFYELGRFARAVWWKNMSGLPGEIDGVLEKLTKKFIAYQKSRNIEEPLYPPGFDDDPPLAEPEDDSGDPVL